jgi:hypothetical protein
MPTSRTGRAHFCSPYKVTGNVVFDTFWFNLAVIWLFSLILYAFLCFNVLTRIVARSGKNPRGRSASGFLEIKEISSF